MRIHRGLSRLVAFVIVLGLAAPLRAQSSFELVPFFAYYQPTGSLASGSLQSLTLPSKPSELSGTAWGAAARYSLSNRFGVKVQAAVASSTVGSQTVTPSGPVGPAGANVLMVSAQATYDVSPSPDFHVLVGAGPGLVRHGGDAYANYGSPVNTGGALGVALDLPVGGPHLRLAAGAESFLYQLAVKNPGSSGNAEGGFQSDLLFRIGLGWRW